MFVELIAVLVVALATTVWHHKNDRRRAADIFVESFWDGLIHVFTTCLAKVVARTIKNI